MSLALAMLPDRPIPLADVPRPLQLQIVAAAGAGFPSPAQDWEETGINLVELLRLDRAASFVFEVRGSSMVDAGIFDRDIVVVDRDGRASNGRIVVAVVDGGFVVRQLCNRAGGVFLEARNRRMEYPAASAEGVEIWGVVRSIVRNLQA